MNEAYQANLLGRAKRYSDGIQRTPGNAVGAVAQLREEERAAVIILHEMEEQLVLENQRRLVAEKALLESEQERQTLERLLKEAAIPKPVLVANDDL